MAGRDHYRPGAGRGKWRAARHPGPAGRDRVFDWPGHQKIDVTVDDDGSVELHWREEPDAPPADVAAAIICAIAAITEYRP